MNNLLNFLNKRRKQLNKSFLPLHEPNITSIDRKHVVKGLKTGFVSTAGKEIMKFENILKKITKSKFVIPTINGTSAIHIGLQVLGVKPNDEVMVPAISFIAPANAILYNQAIPHFVDSEMEHFGVDPNKLDLYLKNNTYIKNNLCFNKRTKRIIRALIVVHVFGHPAQILKIISVAKKYKIKVLEDAAEALGSLYNGKQVGTFADVGVISFAGNKIVTTGMGGAILTTNRQKASISKHIVSTAKLNHKWEFIHDKMGFNYRLANINATLGISQLKRLNKYIKHKRLLYKKFKSFINKNGEFTLLDQPKNCRSNFWLQTIVLKKTSKVKKIKILNNFHKKKIHVRPVWKPLHKLKFLKTYPRMNLQNAEKLENKIINLPSSYYL